MSTPPPSAALRILDASLNRAAEGLRVVEDYLRFSLNDAHLTRQVKQLRHDLAAIAEHCSPAERAAVRDTPGDVGTTISNASEGRRADLWSVCEASFERTKQSLRSLEEYAKLAVPATAPQFESLRYRLYTIEATAIRTADAVERLAGVRLCVLIDGRPSETEFATIVEQLVAAGVHAFQLRDKQLDDRQLLVRARRLCDSVRGGKCNPSPHSSLCASGAPLVFINDRADVAAAADADGVHLGQDDLSVADARAIVGPRKLVGVSTHSIEQARAAVLAGANYLGVGPTFPTQTKQFGQFPGVELLRAVAAEIRLPAFAIGGIGLSNVDDVLAAGFTRIAVSSAVLNAPVPAQAARDLLAKLPGAG